MLKRKKTFFVILGVFLLAFLAANLNFPVYFNQGADFVNSKLKIQDSKYKVPHFPDRPFKLGLDLQGGAHLLYQADLASIPQKEKGRARESLQLIQVDPGPAGCG